MARAFWRARLAGRERAGYPRPLDDGIAARSGFRVARWLRRWSFVVLDMHVPRRAGVTACGAFLLAAIGYGVVVGGHVGAILAYLEEARDRAANAAGFGIASIALAGERHVSREEVLATAGVTGTSSLLFLDVDEARDRLKTNPWIADATVLKLYPDRLQIAIKEREPFALWQKDGRVSVIAADGTVLESYVSPRLVRLPLVVGRGAAERAEGFLAMLDGYPELRDQVRASVLIAGRRWNLRLSNGLDILLPESGVELALTTLVGLDKDKKLLTRDIVSVDLRLPDRVTVRQSAAAAAARAEALKDKKPVKKGNAA